jgi:WD40 repeat protein
MSTSRQYYEVLGLQFSASPDDIKRAYRSLAKQWHPDRFPHDPRQRERAEARFKEISIAYDYLKNTPATARGNDAPKSSGTVDDRARAGIFFRRGEVLARREQYHEAIEEFSRAIYYDPDAVEAYRYRAFLFSKLGFEHRAKADLRTLETLTNKNAPPRPPAKESNVDWIESRATVRYFQPITGVAIDRAGEILVYVTGDRTIGLWSVKDHRTLASLEDTRAIHCSILTPDGNRIITGNDDGTIRCWNLKTGQVEVLGRKNTEHADKVTALVISPDGKTIISGSADKTVKIWTLGKRVAPRSLTGYAAEIAAIAISPDGRYFVAAGLEPHLRIRSVETGKLIRSIRTDSGILSVCFSPDGESLATGGIDRSVRLWHVRTGQEIWHFNDHRDRVSAVLFTPDGQTLISGSWDSTIRFRSVLTKEEIGTLDGHAGKVLSLAMSGDGKILLSGGSDRTVKVWRNQNVDR